MMVVGEITKRLFIAGIAAISVIPRQQVDRDRWSIGGEISYPFRKLLVVVSGLSFFRLTLLALPQSTLMVHFTDTMGVFQQLGHVFICFLTPYLLQTWLAPLINIGGRPGASLMVPLYLNTFLSIISVILVRLVHTRYWFIRKLGNIISTPPVLRTLKMFNSVTTRGGHHSGRGTVLSQSLVATEWWFAITQLLCAIGHGWERSVAKSEYTIMDSILEAFRDLVFISDWTRILMHAIFMNQLDELYLSYSPSGTNGGESSNAEGHCAETGNVELSAALVSKKAPRKTTYDE